MTATEMKGDDEVELNLSLKEKSNIMLLVNIDGREE